MASPLDTVLDLALARSFVVRDVDAALGTYHGLSLSDFALLLELRAAPEQKVRRVDLASRLGVTPSGVARQLAPLERMGLVGRESHDRDARLALVVLTPTGDRIAREALQTAQQAATQALDARWSGDEQASLGTLLARIRP
jgi:DNA-binding MarR family transcriptional regulator